MNDPVQEYMQMFGYPSRVELGEDAYQKLRDDVEKWLLDEYGAKEGIER